MQLNLLNNLNRLIGASNRANQTLAEINGRILGELFTSNVGLLQSTLTASARTFAQHTTPSTQFAIVGKFANEYLESTVQSGKNVAEILTKSRDDYEAWAIECAREFGTITNSSAP